MHISVTFGILDPSFYVYADTFFLPQKTLETMPRSSLPRSNQSDVLAA